ncbi:DUF3310 domain-containing protein [Clostridium sp.]|uniref:DUF3310 domain-containing protein n=1 Tax=Clostridium sp. TaxID=1506 RepID=UPI00290FC927|nr:DUF3310 domain-containing protein [Clostridium sp.]MDU3410666.1 DUF3310 domain-containing protein [Clostridium sp.]
MTLEEFKEHAKIMDKEEFIQRMVEGGSATCPSKYGLEESCGRDCEECARSAVKDIKFKDDIEKDFIEAINKQPIIVSDSVNHPSHYTHGKIETIDKIEDVLGLEGFQAYCVGNAIKYLDRYKLKNGFEDIKKAQRYLEFYIEKTEGKEC